MNVFGGFLVVISGLFELRMCIWLDLQLSWRGAKPGSIVGMAWRRR